MNIVPFLSGITQTITNKTAPRSIPAQVVGNAFADLAQLTKQGIVEVTNNFKSLAKKVNNLTFSAGSFARNDGSFGSNTNYRRTFNLPIERYIPNGGKIYVDFGNEGVSLVGIAQYNNVIASTSSFVGFQEQGVAIEFGIQKRFFELIPFPGATHFIISSRNSFDINIYYSDNLGLSTIYDSTSKKLNVDFIAGYIDNSTNEARGNVNYDHTAALPISLLTPDVVNNKVFLDISNQGASNRPISFWSGSDLIPANYIGAQLNGTNTSPTQYYDLEVVFPSGATHVCFSREKSTVFNLKVLSNYNPIPNSINRDIERINSSLLFSNNNFPLQNDTRQLWMRAATKRFFVDSFPLIYLSAQSNTEGRAPQSSAPQWLIDLGYKIPWYLIWNKIAKRFQPYELGVNTGADNNADTRFSYDIFFAKKHYDTYGKTIYCIKHTLGGTPISEKGAVGSNARFQPKTELIAVGERRMSDEFIIKLNEAHGYLNAYSIKTQPLFISGIQGESDADNSLRLADYPVNFSNWIYFMKGAVLSPNIPIIFPNIMHRNANYNQINTIQAQAALQDPSIHVIDTTVNQGTIDDNLHYNSSALAFIGGKVFDVWQKNYNPVFI